MTNLIDTVFSEGTRGLSQGVTQSEWEGGRETDSERLTGRQREIERDSVTDIDEEEGWVIQME